MKSRSDRVTVFVVRASEDATSHEFLQLRRAANDYMGGTWQIIRGGVDLSETYLAAALRELKEEAGLEPDEFYRLGRVESFYIDKDDTIWHSAAFCAIISRDREIHLNEEHDDFRWIAQGEIARKLMWSSERTLLIEILTDILDDGPAKSYLRVDLSAR